MVERRKRGRRFAGRLTRQAGPRGRGELAGRNVRGLVAGGALVLSIASVFAAAAVPAPVRGAGDAPPRRASTWAPRVTREPGLDALVHAPEASVSGAADAASSQRLAVDVRPWLRVLAPETQDTRGTLRCVLERESPPSHAEAWRCERPLEPGANDLSDAPRDGDVRVRLMRGDEPLREVVLAVPAEAERDTPHEIDLRAQLAAEAAALVHLAEIENAQAAFRRARTVDRNGDGVGEFGFLAELAREGHLFAPLGGYLDERGERAGGYCFRVWLPTYPEAGATAQVGLPLPDAGRGRREIEPLAAAEHFVLYAWPAFREPDGARAFALDAQGTLVALHPTAEEPFRGPKAPTFDAALAAEGDLTSGIALDGQAAGGRRWVRVAR